MCELSRSTGGNRFIPGDSTCADLVAAVARGLLELHRWAEDTDRFIDIGAITVTTRRIPSGAISVTVEGDLADQPLARIRAEQTAEHDTNGASDE